MQLALKWDKIDRCLRGHGFQAVVLSQTARNVVREGVGKGKFTRTINVVVGDKDGVLFK